MMTVRCYLAPSDIEGLGVFCYDDIKQGQVVWRAEPMLDMRIPVTFVEAAEPHVREFLDRYTYPDWNDLSQVVLESDEGRFMNHADEPNLDFTDPAVGVARRDIPAGTEFTCHYSSFTLGEITMQPPRHRVKAVAAE